MPRKPKSAAQAAAQSIKNTPQDLPETSDTEMGDAPSAVSTPRDGGEKEEPTEEPQETDAKPELPEGETETAQAEGESTVAGGAATPAQDSEGPSLQETPSRTPGRVSAIAPTRRRRPGRPPKNRPPDWEAPEDGEGRAEVSTPVKRRGRGRPSAGGRWGRSRGGPSHVTQVPVDKEGNMMNVINDEVDLPEDPQGEQKVDKMGNLLGGREFRVRTFTILDKGERRYMLSTEPARCIGFRDSYLFFQKHKLLYKIIIDDDAKRDLIERDIIPHSYKGRAIGVVTARSVFREFGAKIIIGGRKVVDDYDEKAARERGDVEGELAVPEDRLPGPGETYDKNRYVAWHGASSVYHSGVPSVPMPTGKVVDSKKRKVHVTGDNWMIEHARESSRFNSSINDVRRQNLNGVYDIHTNIMQYPKIMQPTHARWEPIPPPDSHRPSRLRQLDSATKSLSLADSAATNLTTDNNDHPSKPTTTELAPSDADTDSIFAPIPSIFTRNFRIHDIQYESAPQTNLGNPGPGGDDHDVGSNGLISLSGDGATPSWQLLDPEVLAELPAECREAYLETATREWEWKRRWRGEQADGARAKFGVSYAWVP